MAGEDPRPQLDRRFVMAGAAASLAGCATPVLRSPVPEPTLIAGAAPYGIVAEDLPLRGWGDDLDAALRDRLVTRRASVLRQLYASEIAAGRPIRETALLLSGGGPDGAFGAGLMNGWTARGDRPEFTLVTGISTGAIVALFAFLGPDYDDELQEIYTTFHTEQLLVASIFGALRGGPALTDARGYRALIERYVDDEVVAALAAQWRRGRALLIGTTNLDAARPVEWNVTAIAATGHPQARRLIHDVIQASSAIPAVFPPVIVPVTLPDGRVHDEMHVDGGATQQVTFMNPGLPLRRVDRAVGARIDREMWIVINNKLRKPYQPVAPRVLPIAGRAASSLIGGSGGGDVYKIFALAERDGVRLNLISIPPDFDAEPVEPFDPVYMRALFDLGVEAGLAGDRWLDRPLDFVADRPGAG